MPTEADAQHADEWALVHLEQAYVGVVSAIQLLGGPRFEIRALSDDVAQRIRHVALSATHQASTLDTVWTLDAWMCEYLSWHQHAVTYIIMR